MEDASVDTVVSTFTLCTIPGVIEAIRGIRRVPASSSSSSTDLRLRSLVRRLPLGMPATQYYFCESRDCDVVYFGADPQAPVFREEDLLVRVGATDESDPDTVCSCFGFTRRDVSDEVWQTGKSTVVDRITTEAKVGNCACEVKNPSGKCCLGDVRRIVQDCPQRTAQIRGPRLPPDPKSTVCNRMQDILAVCVNRIEFRR